MNADEVRAALTKLDSWDEMENFFYADDSRRRSPEMDFGCWWMSGNVGRTTYRVSAVHATGELYAVRLSRGLRDEPPGVVFLIGRVAPHHYDEAEALLDGWADVCGEKDSLGWVLDRTIPTLG